jgi:hypothetical protein
MLHAVISSSDMRAWDQDFDASAAAAAAALIHRIQAECSLTFV